MEYDAFSKFERTVQYKSAKIKKKTYIGIVLLSTDISLEGDWSAMLRGKARNFTNRIEFSGDMSVQNLQGIKPRLSEAAKNIAAGLDMDVMVFACTSASIVIGSDRISELLNSDRKNTPATNPLKATKQALTHLKAKRIAVLTPYKTDVNYQLYHSFTDNGFEVTNICGLGLQNDIDATKASKKTVFDGVREVLKDKDADAIFISCTNFRVVEHIKKLEETFQIPVVTSNQALLWHALKLAGDEIKLSGYGRLFNT